MIVIINGLVCFYIIKNVLYYQHPIPSQYILN